MTSINNQTNTANLTNGQLNIGHTSNIASASTIAGTSPITVTNGAGSITVATSGIAPQIQLASSVTGAYYIAWPNILMGNPATNLQSTSDSAQYASYQLYMPFSVPNTYTPSNIYIVVDGVLASSSINLGLYTTAANGYQPTGAATNVVNPSTAVAGLVTTSWTPTLTANKLYWIGIQASTSTTMSLVSYKMNPNISAGAGTAANFQSSGSSTEGVLLWRQIVSFSAGSMSAVGTISISDTFSWPIITFL
jgi:hypothetical protein